MSRHLAPSPDPGLRVVVGWQRQAGGYYFSVYEGADQIDHSQLDGDLPTLWHLRRSTWGYVRWSSPEGQELARRLRLDPELEAERDDPDGPPALHALLRQESAA